MIKKTSSRITITLDKNIIKKIEKDCKKKNKSKSEICEDIFSHYYFMQDKEDNKINDLIEQVKRLVYRLDKKDKTTFEDEWF